MSFDPNGIPIGSAFSSAFLHLIDRTDIHAFSTAVALGEAHAAGPWAVRKGSGRWDGLWEVAAEGREPAGAVDTYETAVLMAAAVPALGRRLFRLGNQLPEIGPTAHRLIAGEEAVTGHVATVDPEVFTGYLNVLEYLRRSPLDLARVMYAARNTSLRPAGAILWLWEQAATT
jgi:hypothetical protein